MADSQSQSSNTSIQATGNRLGCLWLSQLARSLADGCFPLFMALQVLRLGPVSYVLAWQIVIPSLLAPFIVLFAFIGMIVNRLPRRWVLVFSSSMSFGAAALANAYLDPVADFSLYCMALACHSAGAALYTGARDALLPAAAQATRIPLGRVVGLIDMAKATGVVGGLLLACLLQRRIVPLLFQMLPWGTSRESVQLLMLLQNYGLFSTMTTIVILNAISALMALPARFSPDAGLPVPVTRLFRHLIQAVRSIWTERQTRAVFLSQAAGEGLLIAGLLTIFASMLPLPVLPPRVFVSADMVWVLAGAAAGPLLAALQTHPRRSLGLPPLAATCLLIAAASTPANAPLGFAFALGLFGGIAAVPLRTSYFASLPADLLGYGAALLKAASYLFAALLTAGLYWCRQKGLLSLQEQWKILTGLIPVGVAILWWRYYHPALEQLLEMLIWPVFRIRAYGPGVSHVSEHGPLLVIANHTAWFDPIWLGKVIPRHITPLMTSRFYDIPVLRWLMVHVVHAIRVQISRYRREVPELGEAIAALDRGECVVVFPEGFMRRREDRPLRRFGQGVWHILSKRPATPVMVCWIEGGWGSYFSYAGGPPTKNKRFDFWRRIQVAMEAPQTLDPALLKDQRATRTYLRRVCLEARRHLGLQPLAQLEAIATEEPEDEVEG